MRGKSGFIQRLLQFGVLAALGCLLFFASAQAQQTVEQRLLAALEARDRAGLIEVLDEDVRTTAASPGGPSRSLEGRASALGYLEGWRAAAGDKLDLMGTERDAQGLRSTVRIRTGLSEAATHGAPPLRIQIENDRVTVIEGAGAIANQANAPPRAR